MRGLSILIDYAQNLGHNEFKKKLVKTIDKIQKQGILYSKVIFTMWYIELSNKKHY